MTKENIVKYGTYIVLAIFIALFIMSVILPKKFDVLMVESNIFLHQFFDVQGWQIVIGSFFSLLGLIKLLEFIASFYPKRLKFHKYKHDTFKNTHWKWKWNDINIENLWCYCPTCNQELSYKCDHLLFKTDFLCQKCEKQISSYDGDNINYVLSKVKAEIRRVVQRKINEEEKKL